MPSGGGRGGALPVKGAVGGREGWTVAAQRTLQGSWQRRKQKRRLGAPGQGKRSVCLYLDAADRSVFSERKVCRERRIENPQGRRRSGAATQEGLLTSPSR